MPGTEIRAVDPETGAVLPPGQPGVMEAKVPMMGPDWIRTTDLVTIDEDGFVFHHARNDGAISRGGFKILPETIVAALRRHPGVSDAAVIGLPDDRLGQVPVAAVELQPGAEASEEGLLGHLRGLLTSMHMPTRILIVQALPRTPSMKVSLTEVRRLFEEGTKP
jgi:acyl-coenzyme A synthetase/AMP-(fatty) acid ligase